MQILLLRACGTQVVLCARTAAGGGGIEMAELPATSAAGPGLHGGVLTSSGGDGPSAVVHAAHFVSSEAHFVMANGAGSGSSGAAGRVEACTAVMGGPPAHALAGPQPVHQHQHPSQVPSTLLMEGVAQHRCSGGRSLPCPHA